MLSRAWSAGLKSNTLTNDELEVPPRGVPGRARPGPGQAEA